MIVTIYIYINNTIFFRGIIYSGLFVFIFHTVWLFVQATTNGSSPTLRLPNKSTVFYINTADSNLKIVSLKYTQQSFKAIYIYTNSCREKRYHWIQIIASYFVSNTTIHTGCISFQTVLSPVSSLYNWFRKSRITCNTKIKVNHIYTNIYVYEFNIKWHLEMYTVIFYLQYILIFN